MRTSPLRAACLGVASLVASACASTPAISNTNNIVRATDVELVCLELSPTGVIPRPTARCALSDTDNGPGANSTFHLHAVVPQFDRGELAVVDLATTSGVALVDNSPATPGYSFLPVGEFPVSITSDIGDSGGFLYVASGRSERVLRVDAAALRADPRRADFSMRRLEIPVGGIPRDLVIVRAGDRRLLVATLPEARAVSFVDVTDGAPGAPQVIALRGGPAAGDAGAGVPAHPVSLAVDDEAGRVYVTDDALDRVHAIDVASRAEVEPIEVGARTRVAVVTGTARARPYACDLAADPDHCARTRYLYLTTADEGAVVAWDLSRGARVRPNLLPQPNVRASRINPGLAVDRIALGAPATALVAINTTSYDPSAAPLPPVGGGSGCMSGYVSPGQGVFSGVFVGVVLRTGQLAVIDIDDYNVDTWEAQCGAAAGGSDTGAYRFVRHAPHAANTLNTDRPLSQPPALKEAPTVTALIGTVPGQSLEMGRAPGFACTATRAMDGVSGCTAANNFGVELPHREVAGGASSNTPADPFTSRNDAWTFVYEGVIPGLEQSGGALVVEADGALRLDAPGGFFCTRGALANDRARDWLVLVSDPTPLAADRDTCSTLFGSGTTPLNRDFVIDRAFEDHLALRAPGGALDGAAVLRCFPQAVQFAVRAGRQWVAVGLSTGFAHAVRVGAGRECELDPVKESETEGYARQCLLTRAPPAETNVEEQLAARCPTGRACTGALAPNESTLRRSLTPLFANPFLCTQIFPALGFAPMTMTVAALPVDRGTQIAFTLANAYEPFLTATGSLPVAVRHLRGVDRLYVVDSAQNGLMEFRFNPFAQGRIFN